MVTTVERLVNDTRLYFKRLTAKTVPFIYVGHDIWDGKSKSVLGLCVFFVSPLLKEMIAIPVGILRNLGKTATQIAQQSLSALERYVKTLLWWVVVYLSLTGHIVSCFFTGSRSTREICVSK
jgi:type III secretory pathway component EscS